MRGLSKLLTTNELSRGWRLTSGVKQSLRSGPSGDIASDDAHFQRFVRLMPSLRIFEFRVVRFIPRRAAAPSASGDDPVRLAECIQNRLPLHLVQGRELDVVFRARPFHPEF